MIQLQEADDWITAWDEVLGETWDELSQTLEDGIQRAMASGAERLTTEL